MQTGGQAQGIRRPPFSATRSRLEGEAEQIVEYSPPSKSLQSGNQLGRLDAYKVSINKEADLSHQSGGGQGVGKDRRLRTVETDDFSHG